MSRKSYRNLTPKQFIDLVYEGFDLKEYKEAHYPKEYEAYCKSQGLSAEKAKTRVKLAKRILRDRVRDAEWLRHIASLQIPFQALVDVCSSTVPDKQFKEFIDAFKVPESDSDLVSQKEAADIWHDICLRHSSQQATLFSEAQNTIDLKEKLARIKADIKDLEDALGA